MENKKKSSFQFLVVDFKIDMFSISLTNFKFIIPFISDDFKIHKTKN